MRSMGCLLVAVVALTTVNAQEKAGEVALSEVKYEGLKEVIRKNRGKVVVVDFWFNT